MRNPKKPVVVVRRASGGQGVDGGCKVCTFPIELIQKVNAEIWVTEVGSARRRSYRQNARLIVQQAGLDCGLPAIQRHGDHVELTARRLDNPQHAATQDEIPVFETDFESVTETIARLGMHAAAQLATRVESGEVEDRELVAVTRMGLASAVERQKATDRSKRAPAQLLAIFGVTSGHLTGGENEIRNVTPLPDLLAAIDAERLAIAAGDEGPDYDEALG